MCYGMGCPYEYSHSGECSIYHLLGTDKMSSDAACQNTTYEGEDEEDGNTSDDFR